MNDGEAEVEACVAKVCGPSGSCIVIIAAYGFPPGHQDRGANEEMFKDLLGALTSLTCPSILVGDLNSTISDSQSLSLASMIGAVVLSPQGSSTTKRSKGRAKREPIDHVIANKPAVDLITLTRFEHNLVVSDHVPIAVTVNLLLPCFNRVVWPKKPPDLPKDPTSRPWDATPEDYQQWQQDAKSWIQDATGVPIPERGSLQTSELKWLAPKPCRGFCRRVKLRRAVIESMVAGGIYKHPRGRNYRYIPGRAHDNCRGGTATTTSYSICTVSAYYSAGVFATASSTKVRSQKFPGKGQ